MTDILLRFTALTHEHPAIGELREYIRRGFGFVAYGGGERMWRLDDKEIRALNTGFTVLDDDRKSLIALVKEAAGEIERVREALHGMLDMFDMCGTVEQDEFERKAIKRAKEALNQQEANHEQG